MRERKKNSRTARVTYEERIVAFVDIMGFKQLVEDSLVDQEEFSRIRDALERFRELKEEKDGSELEKYIKVTTFSDSLVISYPVDYKGGLFEILLDLIYLQFDFAHIGIIIRGGITIGKLRHIREEIFGPAMNAAYALENQKAIFPRIIIEADTIEKGLKKTYDKTCPIEYSLEFEKEQVMSLLKRDEDGLYYLDFLSQYGEFDEYDGYIQFLSEVGHKIGKEKLLNRDNKHVLEKYEWLSKYYNETISRINEKYGLKSV